MSHITIITVDGPSGVGKGTISQMLAEHFGLLLLDSGALYRITALAAQNRQIDFANSQAVAEIARNLDVQFNTLPGQGVEVMLDGENVSGKIRTEKAGNAASIVAAIPEVREALLQRQRDFATTPGVVADGRDMGTTVFPNANVKLFLTASAEIRAQRRYKQLKQKGISASLRDLVEEIAERDERDSNRSASPCKSADDAVIIDTSDLSIDEVFSKAQSICSVSFR